MPNRKKLAKQFDSRENIIYSTRGGSTVPTETLNAMGVFHNIKQPKGTIDVWWLYDDGGNLLFNSAQFKLIKRFFNHFVRSDNAYTVHYIDAIELV